MATQDYAPPDLAEAGTIITAQGRIQIRHSQIIEIVGWGMIILGLWWLSTPLEPWINDLRQIVIPLLVACAIAWVLGHPFGVRVIVLATRLARHYRAWRRKQLILYSPARSADSHYSAKLKLPARALPPSTMPRETAQPPTHQPVTGSPVPTIFNPTMPRETAPSPTHQPVTGSPVPTIFNPAMPRETAPSPTHQPVTGSPVPTIFNPAMPHEAARNQ